MARLKVNRRVVIMAVAAVFAVVAGTWLRPAKRPAYKPRAEIVSRKTADVSGGTGTKALSAPQPLALARPAATVGAGVRSNRPGMVFGETGPVRIDDVPPGRFRNQLAALPPPLRARVLQHLGETRMPLLDVHSVQADNRGGLFYACEIRPEFDAEEPATRGPTSFSLAKHEVAEGAMAAAPVPVSSPPVRHSRPGAATVIHLNFSGSRVSNTLWNEQRKVSEFVCIPYDKDGDTATFGGAEQSDIVDIWERVAEDYRPFDVDVTTEKPAVLTKQTLVAVITRSVGEDLATPNPGAEVGTVVGIAYLDILNSDGIASARPCFIYHDRFPNTRTIANTVSHELGHNLSLRHDGRVIVEQQIQEEYYTGHGTGETSWRPIMGSGFSRLISQWSRGEYFGANNFEDDLAKLGARLGYAPDDHSGTGNQSTPMVVDGPRVNAVGVIGRSDDADVFRFTTGAGQVHFTAQPFHTTNGEAAENLDLALELLDGAGNSVALAAPPETTAVQFSATVPAGTYLLRVSGAGFGSPLASPTTGYTRYGSLGGYAVEGFVPPPDGQPAAPFISRQPRNATAALLGVAEFSVEALGSPGPAFQWQRLAAGGGGSWDSLADDGVYSGVFTETLKVTRATAGMTGDQFRCVVANGAGTLTSVAAALKVLPGGLAISPANTTSPVSSSATFALLVGGAAPTQPLAFQWRKDGVEIPGATGAVFEIAYVERADAGVYSVRVDDSALSEPATFAVTSVSGAPEIAAHPTGGQGVSEDSEFTFRVSVRSQTPVSYQWRKDNADIPGAVAAELTIPHVGFKDGGSYTVRATNAAGSMTSKSAFLAVGFRRPELVSFASDQLAGLGESATFAVEFRSTTPLEYQWYKYQPNAAGVYDRPIPGATGPVLTIANVTAADAGLYSVRVGCIGYGVVGSTFISNFAKGAARAKLTVITRWVFLEEPASQVVKAGDNVYLHGSIYSPDGTADLSPTTKQWWKNGVEIPGATETVLTIPKAQLADEGSYTFSVTNRSGATVSQPATLTVAGAAGPASAPLITLQPVGASAAVGANLQMLVGAASNLPLSYQWRKDGVALPGKTLAILGLNNVQAGAAGVYSVVVTNASGSVESAVATIGVGTSGELSAFVTQPANASVATGGTVTFSVAVTSATPVTYQWQMAGSMPLPLLGATGSSLTLTNVRADFAGDYQVVVFNAAGVAFSQIARLTVVNTVASIIVADSNSSFAYQAVLAGEEAYFRVGATSVLPLAYQWSKDGVAIPGATAAVFTLAHAQPGDQGVYRALVSNADGSVLSKNFNLWVFPVVPPEIVTQPSGRTAAVGDNISFSVVVRSDRPLTYQWRKNGLDIAEGQGTVLVVSSAQAADSGIYSVRVSNRSGTVVSSPALLVVGPAISLPPVFVAQPTGWMVPVGGSARIAAVVSSADALSYQWRKNGQPVPGATAAALDFVNVQPVDAGIYTVVASAGSATSLSEPAIIGIAAVEKVTGAGAEVGANIVHANGNSYDQVLLQGAAVAVTADANQITRISFIDLTDDIVQVEFSGAGTLSLVLEGASGPAAPVNYNQPAVAYMKGHGRIVITGADETTNVSVFSVGRITALNQALFKSDVAYDGAADLGSIAIQSLNGKFGGVRTANASYYATKGLTGIYAPGVQFTGPVYVGDVNAFDAALPVLVLGAAGDTSITGGDLFQTNGQPVKVSGITQLKFVNGTTSHGAVLPAQVNKARLEQNGTDVTAQIVVNPAP